MARSAAAPRQDTRPTGAARRPMPGSRRPARGSEHSYHWHMASVVCRVQGEGMVAAAPPSGKQFFLQLGSSTAVVTEVGAGLRSYCAGGVELLDGYGVDEMCSGARGQTFIPWPNRI